jgi:hypothetical protein
MKISTTTAAVRCAAANGRTAAGRFGKFAMSSLLRTSYLSMLHLPGLGSTLGRYLGAKPEFARKPGRPAAIATEARRSVVHRRDRWQQSGDTRLVAIITNVVMRGQENPANKALALS